MQSKKIDELIDSYYKLDFEDIISGGLKTRFKYKKIEPNAYNLDDEDLLYADDKKLNSYISTKKLAPYRPDKGYVNINRRKN